MSKSDVEALIVVVHGVGDTKPGETVDLLSASLNASANQAKEGHSHAVASEVHWFEEQSPEPDANGDRQTSLFPCQVRHATIHSRKEKARKQRLVLAEVNWADVSRPANHLFGVIREFFRLMFHLEYIFEEAHGSSKDKGLYYRLAKLAIELIRGPIAAINVLMAVVVLLQYCVYYIVTPDSAKSTKQASVALSDPYVSVTVLAGCILAPVIIRFLFGNWKSQRVHSFFQWLVSLSVLFAVLSIGTLSVYVSGPRSKQGYAGSPHHTMQSTLYSFLEKTERKVIAQPAPGPNATVKPGTKALALAWYGAWFLVVLYVFWFAVYCLLLLTMIDGWTYFDDGNHAALVAFYSTTWIWLMLVESLWATLSGLPVLVNSVFLAGMALLGVGWACTALIGLVFIIEWQRLSKWGRTYSEHLNEYSEDSNRERETKCGNGQSDCCEGLSAGRKPPEEQRFEEKHKRPRMIIPSYLSFVMSLCVGITVLVATLLFFYYLPFFFGQEPASWLTWFVGVLFQSVHLGIVIATLVAGLVVSYFLEPIRKGLDLFQDVVTHFFGFLDEESNERKEQKAKKEERRYVLRQLIQARIEKIAVSLCAHYQPQRVIFVAHSQGSVEVIQLLAESKEELQALKTMENGTERETFLMTLGSPYTHLYAKYFGKQYRKGPQEEFVEQWINMFRVDDYIGTYIEVCEGRRPRNRALPSGGHTMYWNQKDVVAVLQGMIDGDATPVLDGLEGKGEP